MTTSSSTTSQVPRRIWLGVLFAMCGTASLLYAVPAVEDGEILATGRRVVLGLFFWLYTIGHFRWPHHDWPRTGEKVGATLVVSYVAIVGLSLLEW